MSGCKTQQDAADDRELERIMKMTDAEVLAQVTDDEIEKVKQASIEAKRIMDEELDRRRKARAGVAA